MEDKNWIPENCYDCWINGDDHCDGRYCDLLGRIVQWFIRRRLKPTDCPLV